MSGGGEPNPFKAGVMSTGPIALQVQSEPDSPARHIGNAWLRRIRLYRGEEAILARLSAEADELRRTRK